MDLSKTLLFPVLAQVMLTVVLIVWAGRARISAVRRGDARIRDIALSGEAWPTRVRQISNNMNNQFETPILFYVLAGAATLVGATGGLMTALAWGYVATRVAHTAVHVTSNNVVRRLQVFALGLLCLALMWVGVVAHLFGG